MEEETSAMISEDFSHEFPGSCEFPKKLRLVGLPTISIPKERLILRSSGNFISREN